MGPYPPEMLYRLRHQNRTRPDLICIWSFRKRALGARERGLAAGCVMAVELVSALVRP